MTHQSIRIRHLHSASHPPSTSHVIRQLVSKRKRFAYFSDLSESTQDDLYSFCKSLPLRTNSSRLDMLCDTNRKWTSSQVRKATESHDCLLLNLDPDFLFQACYCHSTRLRSNCIAEPVPRFILHIRGKGVVQVVRAELAQLPAGKFMKKHVLPGSLTEYTLVELPLIVLLTYVVLFRLIRSPISCCKWEFISPLVYYISNSNPIFFLNLNYSLY